MTVARICLAESEPLRLLLAVVIVSLSCMLHTVPYGQLERSGFSFFVVVRRSG